MILYTLLCGASPFAQVIPNLSLTLTLPLTLPLPLPLTRCAMLAKATTEQIHLLQAQRQPEA